MGGEMEGAKWSHCFLCLSAEDGAEDKRGEEVSSLSKVMGTTCTYLLGSYKQVREDVVKLFVEEGEDKVNKSQRLSSGVIVLLCASCRKLTEDLEELHLQLEEIQRRLAERVKALQDVVVCNSRLYGRNGEAKKCLEELEEWVEGQEKLRSNVEAERKFLSLLHEFQTIVFKKETADHISPKGRIFGDFEENSSLDNNINAKVGKGAFVGLEEDQIKEESEDQRSEDDIGNDFETDLMAIENMFENADVTPGETADSDLLEKEDKHMRYTPLSASDFEENSLNVASSYVEPSSSSSNKIKRKRSPVATRRSPRIAVSKKIIRGRRRVISSGDSDSEIEKLNSDNDVSTANLTKAQQLAVKLRQKPRFTPVVPPKKAKYFKCLEDSTPKNQPRCRFYRHGYSVFERHLREEHETSEKNHTCPDCLRQFTTRDFFEFHVVYHCGLPSVQCHLCSLVLTPKNVKEHLQSAHKLDKVFQCNFCILSFGNSVALINHLPDHGINYFKCDQCPSSGMEGPRGFTKLEYINHLYEVHEHKTSVKFRCDFPNCTVLYSNSLDLSLHQKNHSHKCSNCDEEFKTPEPMRLHLKSEHNIDELLFQCDICGKKYGDAGNLKNHEGYHRIFRHKCDLCPGKLYVNNTALAEHKLKAHGIKVEKTYGCDDCGRRFDDDESLREHQLEKHKPGIQDFHAEMSGETEVKSRNQKQEDAEEETEDGKKLATSGVSSDSSSGSSSCAESSTDDEKDDDYVPYATDLEHEPMESCSKDKSTDSPKTKKKKTVAIRANAVGDQPDLTAGPLTTAQRIAVSLRKHPRFRPLTQAKRVKSFTCTYDKCRLHLGGCIPFERHLREQHETPEKNYTCPDCQRQFTTKELFEFHLVYHCGRVSVDCHLCFVALAPNRLKDHLQSAHNLVKVVPCKFCILSFGNLAGLTIHLVSHGMTSFECFTCPPNEDGTPVAFTRAEFVRHLKKVHGDKDGTSAFQFEFLNSSNVQTFSSEQQNNNPDQHQRSRRKLSNKPHPCDECGKIFLQKKKLTNHKAAVHRQRVRVKCDLCSRKQFRNSDSLAVHKFKVHGVGTPKVYKCDDCDQKYYRLESLRLHCYKRHREAHVCPVCGYSTTLILRFKNHLETHEGVDKFTCSHCPEFFSTRKELDNHLGSHNDGDIAGFSKSGGGSGAEVIADNTGEENAQSFAEDCEDTYVSSEDKEDSGFAASIKPKRVDARSKTNVTSQKGRRCLPPNESEFETTETSIQEKSGISEPTSLTAAQRAAAELRKSTRFRPKKRKRFICNHDNTCSYSCVGYPQLERHVREQHETPEKNYTCPDCLREFTTQELFELHLVYHCGLVNVECHFCSVAVAPKDLKDHLQSVHKLHKPLPCSFCNLSFGNLVAHSKHLEVHGIDSFKCEECVPNCDFILSEYLKHLYEVHGQGDPPPPSILKCDECGKEFSQGLRLENHKRYFHHKVRLKCDLCPQKARYANLATLALHKSKVHGIPIVRICGYDGCEETFENSDQLWRHRCKVHKTEKSLVCEVCGYATNSRARLTKHHATHQTESNFACSYCPKTFSSQHQLKNHYRYHSDPGDKLNCDLCDFVGSNRYSIYSHMKNHHGSRQPDPDPSKWPYECSTCHLRFPSLFQCNNHRAREHDEKPFVCTICDASFSARHLLSDHRHKKHPETHHTQEIRQSSYRTKTKQPQTFLCPHCPKTYKSNALLSYHLHGHSNEKKFVCDQCPAAFKRKLSLYAHRKWKHWKGSEGGKLQCDTCGLVSTNLGSFQTHLKTHDEAARKFACEQCPKKFTQSRLLKQHLLSHSTENQYRCEPCNMSFRYLGSLWFHNNKKHNNATATEQNLN